MKQYIKQEIRDLLIDILSINREIKKVTLTNTKKTKSVWDSSSTVSETEIIFDRTQIEQYQKSIQIQKQKAQTLRIIWNILTGFSKSTILSTSNYINIELFEKTFLLDTLLSDQTVADCFYLINTIIDELEYKLDKILFSLIVVPKIEYRKTRLIPRSIPRTFERFFDELKLTAENKYIDEFYLSRNQIWIATKSFLILFLTPLIVTWLTKIVCIEPLVTYEWNQYQTNLFLNRQQEKYALEELKDFEDQIYFEELVRVSDRSNTLIQRDLTTLAPIELSKNLQFSEFESGFLVQSKSDKFFEPIKDDEQLAVQRIEGKMFELAKQYNQHSIELITNLLGDVITLIIFLLLIQPFKQEIRVIRSVLGEILYSLNDTTKSFVIILLTDLLVGFHSPKGWDILIQATLDHFALPQNEDFVFLCVATFPVLLDTAFKYWIFRYLNRLSPSTVVTYHNIIE